ncbi:TatD family hydrolase [Polynucleobacter paneuropaeus]|jgi:TatD DNase family protein|uniref:DNAase n=1 Tax=Polynucleobacter paneuropaeus TaxID=2527775 RepID=A0AAE3CH22_9BURK|nr:TatD family hydrolase [Polynucleobacter paneuropaeus]MBT8518323.1 TatD family hydrolase [Polynucleobacter paneuropaeus]MBT8520997.1 TatD family hydrolase [Polynucleobacter paneuropaeus]MBT8531398.1 TatD family hydrolase [Polynucleobacter paneuropaeus]MBT8538451.1 TatD family hydrolase [Polynucleobacter paneuropaeus]MBT8566843.1 TatD family hydrolase [Polynucleobacter paneuropaeus]
MFIDSHCHLDFPEFQSRLPEVLSNMEKANVQHALCVSVDLPDFPKVLKLAEDHTHLYASVGVHPDYEDTPEPSFEFLVETAKHPKIVAIGETGLDYYRMGDRSYESMEWQRERFRTHIRAAIASKRPLIIHTRSASADTLRILQEEGASKIGGVMHCFTESLEVAQAAMEMGFFISFSGIVTFKSAKDLQETCRQVPLDKLLIETDSPYLAPVPYRGKTNEPAWVAQVGEFVADLKGVSVERLAKQTYDNFFECFQIDRSFS